MTLVEEGRWRASVETDQPQASYDVKGWLTWDDPEPRRCPDFPVLRAVLELRRTPRSVSSAALGGGELRHADGLHFYVAQPSERMTVGARASCPSSLSKPLVPGLTRELAQAVLDGLVRVPVTPQHCGQLTVDRAGYDEVESSPFVFERAAGLLRGVLVARARGQDEAQELHRLMILLSSAPAL